jgi:hypothetical protein
MLKTLSSHTSTHLSKFYGDFMTDAQLFKVPSLICKTKQELEEQVLKQVLAQLFKREVTDEDARRVTRVFFYNVFDSYALAVDGIHIGDVELKDTGFNYSVRFMPAVAFR